MTMYNHPLNTQRYAELAMIIRSSIRSIANSFVQRNKFIRLVSVDEKTGNTNEVYINRNDILQFCSVTDQYENDNQQNSYIVTSYKTYTVKETVPKIITLLGLE